QRLELKKGLTVIHLQPKEGGISADSYDDLSEIKSTWYGIYYHYQNNITDASKSAQDEVRFMEAVIKYDKEIKSSSRDDREADKGGDFKSSREITGGADKSSKGTGRGEKYSDDENKVVSAVAYTTTISTTTYGVQSVEDTHLDIPLRKNLQETAFFYPHLQTNKDGEVIIDFTAPEALTKWKFRGLAHNKTTDFIYVESLSKTQKDVMIQPNMPRFVRETDVVVLKARVSNTTNVTLQATAVLRLFNTVTGEDLTEQIIKTDKLVPTTINGLSANTVSWSVEIPKEIEGLQYRISVKAGNFTDGEESVIPVLSNRTLITETAPIWQLGKQNKDYSLHNLMTNNSQTLKNHQFVVEISHNATWLTMQSLPYLYDFQHTCNEQIFAKYFADVLAMHVLEKNPSIKDLITEWKNNPKSKLEENEELKQLMLQETPWMKDLVSNEEKKAQ